MKRNRMMSTIAALAFACVSLSTGPTFAEAKKNVRYQAKLSIERAREIALAKVAGVFRQEELEKDVRREYHYQGKRS